MSASSIDHTPPAPGPEADTGQPPRPWMARLAGQEIFGVLLVLGLISAMISPVFLSSENISNVLNQSSVLGLLACAQFLVVLIGGFDLSVAAVMALASMIFATYAPASIPLAAAGSLGAGMMLGALSGVSVYLARVTPLIATLGVMGIARGMSFVVGEKSVQLSPEIFSVADLNIGIISFPVMIWAVVTVFLGWALARTRAGRNVYAIGGNERAARLAGLPVRKQGIAVYTLAGCLSALAGIVLVMRTTSGIPHVGAGWELDAIAAIVIGGARLFGGEGNIMKAMVGVLIYQIISNILNLVGLDPFYQDIAKASVIVLVVGINVMRTRRAESATL